MNEDIFHLGVKALIKNAEGQYLVLRINQDDFITKVANHWDLPGGRIHRGEAVHEALQREVNEEIGDVKLSDIQPMIMILSGMRIPVDPEAGLILSIYTCTMSEDTPIVLNEEHVEFRWVSRQEAAELLEFKFTKVFSDKLRSI